MAAAATRLRDALEDVRADLANQSAQLSLHAAQLDALQEAVDELAANANDLAALIAEHQTDAADLQALIVASRPPSTSSRTTAHPRGCSSPRTLRPRRPRPMRS